MKKALCLAAYSTGFLIVNLVLFGVMTLILLFLFGMHGDISLVVSTWISAFTGAGAAAYLVALLGRRWSPNIGDKSFMVAFSIGAFFWNGSSLLMAPDMSEMVIRAISVFLTLGAIWLSWKVGWD
jgi:hypothetical protein